MPGFNEFICELSLDRYFRLYLSALLKQTAYALRANHGRTTIAHDVSLSIFMPLFYRAAA